MYFMPNRRTQKLVRVEERPVVITYCCFCGREPGRCTCVEEDAHFISMRLEKDGDDQIG